MGHRFIVYSMDTQLAVRSPNSDFGSGKFGPRPTIGPNSDFYPFLGMELIVMLNAQSLKSQ